MAEEKKDTIFSSDGNEIKQDFITPEALYQELIAHVQKYHPSDNISMI